MTIRPRAYHPPMPGQPTLEELRADLAAAQARSGELDAELARDVERGVNLRTPAGKARRLEMDALRYRIGHLVYEIGQLVGGHEPPPAKVDWAAPKV